MLNTDIVNGWHMRLPQLMIATSDPVSLVLNRIAVLLRMACAPIEAMVQVGCIPFFVSYAPSDLQPSVVGVA